MRYLLTFSIIYLLLIIAIPFSFAQEPQEPSEPLVGAPKTLEEAETMGKEILWGFPQALKKPWQEAVAVWSKMGGWFGNFWNSYIYPWLKSIWQMVYSFLGKEVEKRKPEVKEEFEIEKQEMREEIPKVTKSLWERFKALIK